MNRRQGMMNRRRVLFVAATFRGASLAPAQEARPILPDPWQPAEESIVAQAPAVHDEGDAPVMALDWIDAGASSGAATATDGRASEAWEAPAVQTFNGARAIASFDSAPGTVSNIFYDNDLRQAIQDLAMAAQRTVILDPSVQGLVTAEIRDLPLEEAIRLLLVGTGYQLYDAGDYLLVYAPDPESPAFQQLAETRLHQLDYLDATVAANLLPQALQQYVRPRAESNSIAITAPAPILDQVVAALEQLDVVPTQFLLESRVMVFEEGSIDELGVRWAWPGVRAGTFSSDARHGGDAPNRGSAWPWGIEIGYAPGGEFTNGLLAQLEALVVDDRASIIANPRLMAQNGEEAVIQVTTEEYFEVLTQGFYTSSQLEKIESGTTLTIVPTMGDDGRIMLRIEAEVSDVVARGENNLPVVSRRITRNSVWIEDGGTATIAGLVDTRERKGQQRVPVLGRIPLLGRLFRYDVEDDSRREVGIFITARALDPYEDRITHSMLSGLELDDVDSYQTLAGIGLQ